MATIVRRKRSKPTPERHPLYDVLNDLGATLQHAEQIVARDALGAVERFDLDAVTVAVGQLLDSCRYITTLADHIEAWQDATDNGGREWSAADLYGRSLGHRRILFLELIAWAIKQAEAPRTRAEFGRFEAALQRARVADWGTLPWPTLPWPKATDGERFERYVRDLANGFYRVGRQLSRPHRLGLIHLGPEPCPHPAGLRRSTRP
jgi:hypothetical protein